MTTALTWTTPAGSIGTFSEGAIVNQTFVAQPSQMATTLVYTLLNGSFANGETSPLTLSTSGILTGTLAPVNQDTTSTFTIRCQEYLSSVVVGLADRTFSMLVEGPDAPAFTLASGSSLFSTPDSTWIDYQVMYTANDPDVTCVITLASGELPLGLEINEAGVIRGYASPPVNNSNVAINKTYSFTLSLTSESGSVQASYTATITNQELNPLFSGRAPVIFNVQTPLFVMPQTDPYYGYYLTSYNIGSFTHDNNFIFKIIGHDFDGSPLNYVIDLPPALGLIADTNTVTVNVSQSIALTSTIVVDSTVGLIINQAVTFAAPIGGLLAAPTQYYVASITSSTEFTVASSPYGSVLPVTDDTVSTTVSQTQYNGWISGTLPNIGTDINTYYISAYTYTASNPLLNSQPIVLSLTVVGDVNPNIVWDTGSNLGLIVNGEISTKSVQASNIYRTNLLTVATSSVTDRVEVLDTSKIQANGVVVFAASIGGLTGGVTYYVNSVIDSTHFTVSLTAGGAVLPLLTETVAVSVAYTYDTPLYYRVVGDTVSFELRTIINTASDFFAFGAANYVALGTATASEWTTGDAINSVAFNNSFYDGTNIICVGYDSFLDPKIYITLDGVSYQELVVNAAEPLWQVIKPSTIYLAVGESGTVVTTTDISTTWQPSSSGTVADLFGTTYGFTKYVAVGDHAIIYSSDTVTWTTVSPSPAYVLRGICFTGTNFVAVGDSGVIATSLDSITWTYDSVTSHDLMAIAYHSGTLIAVGHEGTILSSMDLGVTWTSESSATLNDLYAIYYDSTTTNDWYAVGEGGTIISRSSPIWTNITLGTIPPNLILEHNGDITGRLAFQSTNSVVSQGTETSYTFNVQAYSDVYTEVNSVKEFTLTTLQEFDTPYDNLYIKGLVSLIDREKLPYILDNSLIPDDYVYRINDPYFGKASSIIYQHMFGVPTVVTSEYIDAVDINHYGRNISLGEIKTAIARDSTNSVVYEVVYSEISDNMTNSVKSLNWPYLITLSLNQEYINSLNTNGIFADYINPMARGVTAVVSNSATIELNSVDGLVIGMQVSGSTVTGTPTVTAIHQSSSPVDACTVTVSANQTLAIGDRLFFENTEWTTTRTATSFYPNSLDNMRSQISSAIGNINNPLILPLWMRSQQEDGNIPGYVAAWVICYTLPGYSSIIKTNLDSYFEANPEYALNKINFQLDRFERDQSLTYNYDPDTDTWSTLPSAQPSITGDSADSYVFFPRKTILPTQGQ